MGLSLLWPLGLVALAAWLVPLLIHLARRQEAHLTEFAALRWLRARPKPRRQVRFDEWPLLLLRLLLLALLALLLAGLALRGHDDARPRVAVATGIDVAAARRAIDAPADARWLWLAPGFPPIDAPPAAGPQPHASLLRELDAQLSVGVPLTVLVPTVLDGVDAQRPRLSRPVDWRVLPSAPQVARQAASRPPGLRVLTDDPAHAALRYLRALQAAWHGAAPLPIAPTAAAPPARDGDIVAIWLSPAALPSAWQDAIREGGQVLLEPRTPLPAATTMQPQWRGEDGRVVLESAAFGRGRIWRLGAPLQASATPELLDAGFATALLDRLRPPPSPSRVDSAGFPPLSGRSPWPLPPRPLIDALVALIALLFLIERVWASSPRRGARA
ncbi:MAG TPA: BatA domain-containing protein [Stenotrophomonas sp.]|jgi:hypothetical protein